MIESATPRVEGVIDEGRAAGGEAMMAMRCGTVVTLDIGLTDAGSDAAVSEIHPPGAGLLD